MVQIKVEEEAKLEDKAKDSPEEVPDEQVKANREGDTQANKEVPLENMKKAELVKKVKETQESADNNYDLYMRSLAEIENLKKRFQKEKSDLIKFSNESIIKQLLTVIDNLENALSASKGENSIDAIVKGIELTLKGLMDILEKSGLKQVEAEGEPFDPNYHEAISEQADDQAEPGAVLMSLQKGYVLNDRLIRPAMVVVSKSNA